MKRLILSAPPVALACLLALFLVVRLPGIHMPYHQDEFKSVIAAQTSLAAAQGYFLHPPLTALSMRADALVFGGSDMRYMPLLFGLLSAYLLYLVMRRRFDERSARWALFLYAVSFYGVWASLMIDTDGAILPTLFLAAVYCYDRMREGSDHSHRWGALLALSLFAGLMVKLSFVLVVGALALDALIEYRRALSRRAVLGAVGGVAALALVALIGFLAFASLDPSFELSGMIAHADSFVHIGGRNWLQIFIQALKAFYYLSPLLLAPLLLVSRDVAQRARVFIIYLAIGLFFYLVLFDFSQGAIDKYLLFTVVPCAALSGAVLARAIGLIRSRRVMGLGIGAACAALALIALNFIPQIAVPLYPKTEWFGKVLHGHWNVLTPFTGGSGPLGFYVSFLFIASCYGAAFIAAVVARYRADARLGALLLVLMVGLAYNAVFIEEFSFGAINGSAPSALASALAFAKETPSVSSLLTYNDIGAYELSMMGKYAGRFYAAPQFEAGHRSLFASYAATGGDFLVVGVPPLYDGFYTEFFSGCAILFSTHSGAIPATIYGSCSHTPH